MPAILPLWWNWPADQRKKVKQLRWMTFGDFRRIQRGETPQLDVPPVTVRDHVRLRTRSHVLRTVAESTASCLKCRFPT